VYIAGPAETGPVSYRTGNGAYTTAASPRATAISVPSNIQPKIHVQWRGVLARSARWQASVALAKGSRIS
jgi:hypothetical protein